MKILYVITGLGMGGAETITIDVAQKCLNGDMKWQFYI